MLKTSKSFRPGFSILELLIVLAIVGILGTIVVYALNLSRARARDSKRVSDITVLRSALNQYWLQKAVYPERSATNLGQSGAGADRFTTDGFVGADGGGTTLLGRVPIGPKAKEYYRYQGTPNGYSIRFTTERDTVYGKGGTYFAHANGIDVEDLEK